MRIFAYGIGAAVCVGSLALGGCAERSSKIQTYEVNPERGRIERVVQTTAVIQPQSRLEMKPPVAGRIDSILVREGDEVSAGQIVAYMSSTERAALLDAARSKGQEEFHRWEEVYKPIPLIAPIDGTVIVSTLKPGQAVTQADPVLVLSDRLIVQAQVDETDIGKINEGQIGSVVLDAYPEIEVGATVQHIYHESKTVNNVTIYQVDLLPDQVPPVFRSGMSAGVRIVTQSRPETILLPVEAVRVSASGAFVSVRESDRGRPVEKPVTVGESDGGRIEILSGLVGDERIVASKVRYAPGKKSKNSSPFLPARPGQSKRPNSAER